MPPHGAPWAGPWIMDELNRAAEQDRRLTQQFHEEADLMQPAPDYVKEEPQFLYVLETMNESNGVRRALRRWLYVAGALFAVGVAYLAGLI